MIRHAAGFTQVKSPVRSWMYSMSLAFWTKSKSWLADSAEMLPGLRSGVPGVPGAVEACSTLWCGSRGWAGLGGLPMLFNLSLPAGDVREGMQLYPILEGLAKWIIGCVLRQVTSGRGLRRSPLDCHLSDASP